MAIMKSVVLLLTTALLGALGIQITDLRVPSAVRNNSGSAALLDCEYTLKPEELATEKYSGLVVKWYFNNSPSPVYQWIPGKKPQDLGILKGRLDLSHRASDHGASMHRALYIPNPTTELSGEYKCLVSTFNDEDFMTKKMVVFAAEKNLHITWTKHDSGAVNVTCNAQGVYPEPKMALYRDSKNKESLKDVLVQVSRSHMCFDISATKILDDGDVQTPTIFDCELKIPEAQYAVRKSIVYYPGIPYPGSDSAACGIHCWRVVMLMCLLALVSVQSAMITEGFWDVSYTTTVHYPEDGFSLIIRNVSIHLLVYMASRLRGLALLYSDYGRWVKGDFGGYIGRGKSTVIYS